MQNRARDQVASPVGGYQDLPTGGHEEDKMAITERDRIR
jgi:hypothetical protein